MRDLKKTNPKKGGTAAAAGSAFSIVSNVAATRTRRSHKKREKSQKAVLPNCARASRDARDARARPREVRIELTGRIVVPPISSSRPFGANGPGTAGGASNSTDNPPPARDHAVADGPADGLDEQPRRGVPDADHGVRLAATDLRGCRGVQQAARHVHDRQRCASRVPRARCNDPRDRCHTIPRGRAPLSFSAFLTRPRPTRPRRTQSKPRIA
jgi:hypothetical protein